MEDIGTSVGNEWGMPRVMNLRAKNGERHKNAVAMIQLNTKRPDKEHPGLTSGGAPGKRALGL